MHSDHFKGRTHIHVVITINLNVPFGSDLNKRRDWMTTGKMRNVKEMQIQSTS